jgi:hypothetical protein
MAPCTLCDNRRDFLAMSVCKPERVVSTCGESPCNDLLLAGPTLLMEPVENTAEQLIGALLVSRKSGTVACSWNLNNDTGPSIGDRAVRKACTLRAVAKESKPDLFSKTSADFSDHLSRPRIDMSMGKPSGFCTRGLRTKTGILDPTSADSFKAYICGIEYSRTGSWSTLNPSRYCQQDSLGNSS